LDMLYVTKTRRVALKSKRKSLYNFLDFTQIENRYLLRVEIF